MFIFSIMVTDQVIKVVQTIVGTIQITTCDYSTNLNVTYYESKLHQYSFLNDLKIRK